MRTLTFDPIRGGSSSGAGQLLLGMWNFATYGSQLSLQCIRDGFQQAIPRRSLREVGRNLFDQRKR